MNRTNWQLALVCGDQRVDLLTDPASSGWTLSEKGANLTTGDISVNYTGATPWRAGSNRTSSFRENAQFTLKLNLKNQVGLAILQKNVQDVYNFVMKTWYYYEEKGRDAVYLVVRRDEGYSGTGKNVVLYGRGDLYYEVVSIDNLMFPDDIYSSLVQSAGTISLANTMLKLTCKPYAVGKPTFVGEATGWVRTDTDGNIEIWAGATNLIHNPGFEHATFNTDWTSSNANLTATIQHQRVHSGFQSTRLQSVDTSTGYTYMVTLTLASQVYAISCYAYTDGTAVTSADCSLVGQNTQLTTTYTADADKPGWYRLTALFSGIAASSLHGIRIEAGKSVFVDDFQLEIFTATGITAASLLLSNYSFETAGGGDPDFFANWTEAADDGVIAQSSVSPAAGTYLCQLTGGASTQLTSVSQAAAVTAGTAYILYYYTRGDATYAGRFRIYDVTNAADIIAISTTGITAATNTLCSVYFVAPVGCTSVSVWFYCPAANGGNAFFDSAILMLWPTGIAAHSPFMLKDGYKAGPGVAWATTEHDSNQTRTAGQYRTRSYWIQQPGHEIIFSGKGGISMWVKTPWTGADRGTHYLFDCYSTTTTLRWRLYTNGSNALVFDVFGSTTNGYKQLSGTLTASNWAADTWHHVYVDWDDFSPVTLYLDGAVLDSTITSSGTWTNPYTLGSYFYLGSTGAGASQLNGWIGDVRIFGPDATVTAANLYRSGNGRGKSLLPFIWTSTIGGTVSSTDDTDHKNYFWIGNLGGDIQTPLRLLLYNDTGSWNSFYLSLHKGVQFPYYLNVQESAGSYYGTSSPSTVSDTARSGSSYLRLSAASNVNTTAAWIILNDARIAPYVHTGGRYRAFAVVSSCITASGYIYYRANIAHDTAASGAAVLSVHNGRPWTDPAYSARSGSWEVVNLGTLDIVLADMPKPFYGQDRGATSLTTNYISFMTIGSNLAASTINMDYDYFVFMPEKGVISGSVASDDVFIIDGINNGISYYSNDSGSNLAMEVSGQASYSGEIPVLAPYTWVFGNVLLDRTTTQTPADQINIAVIYQPRFLH